MSTMISSQACICLAASIVTGVAALSFGLPAASAGQPRPADAEALQVLADVVLIESACRQLNVDYGRLFAFAQRNGISPVEIMPTGERRAAFDAAYARRAREMGVDRLCGALAAERAVTIPGVFMAR